MAQQDLSGDGGDDAGGCAVSDCAEQKLLCCWTTLAAVRSTGLSVNSAADGTEAVLAAWFAAAAQRQEVKDLFC